MEGQCLLCSSAPGNMQSRGAWRAEVAGDPQIVGISMTERWQ